MANGNSSHGSAKILIEKPSGVEPETVAKNPSDARPSLERIEGQLDVLDSTLYPLLKASKGVDTDLTLKIVAACRANSALRLQVVKARKIAARGGGGG